MAGTRIEHCWYSSNYTCSAILLTVGTSTNSRLGNSSWANKQKARQATGMRFTERKNNSFRSQHDIVTLVKWHLHHTARRNCCLIWCEKCIYLSLSLCKVPALRHCCHYVMKNHLNYTMCTCWAPAWLLYFRNCCLQYHYLYYSATASSPSKLPHYAVSAVHFTSIT